MPCGARAEPRPLQQAPRPVPHALRKEGLWKIPFATRWPSPEPDAKGLECAPPRMAGVAALAQRLIAHHHTGVALVHTGGGPVSGVLWAFYGRFLPARPERTA